MKGLGKEFFILGFKNKLTSSSLIFLIAINLETISLKLKLSFKKFTVS